MRARRREFVDWVVVRHRGCSDGAGLIVGRQPARQAILRESCFLSIRRSSGECSVGVAGISNPFHCRLEIRAGRIGGSRVGCVRRQLLSAASHVHTEVGVGCSPRKITIKALKCQDTKLVPKWELEIGDRPGQFTSACLRRLQKAQASSRPRPRTKFQVRRCA